MDRKAFKDEIAFRLTGGVLQLELDDVALDNVLNAAFREVQRYIDTTKIVTIPFQRCIDLKGAKVSAVSTVMRADPRGGGFTNYGASMSDPITASMWQIMSGGAMHNVANFVLNYASYNTLLQIRNTVSTDLDFYYDKSSEQLYINVLDSQPPYITIEFVPRYDDVSEVVSDYWIDIIMRMAVALAKVTLGRIRSRYKQTNALWENDGDTLLTEGNTELSELRSMLSSNANVTYPLD